MWLSLTSGYSVIRCAAIPLLVRSKTPLVFTFFDIFASTFKKNFNGEFNRHGALAMNVDFSRIFFSCVFNTLPIHQLIIIARATRSSRTPKKKAPVVLVGNRERRDAKGGRVVVVVSLLFVSLSASLRPPFFRFVSREGGENWKTKDADDDAPSSGSSSPRWHSRVLFYVRAFEDRDDSPFRNRDEGWWYRD